MKIALKKRKRRRINSAGQVVTHVRYVLDFIDPFSRRRKQLFFLSQEEAIEARRQLFESHKEGRSGPLAMTVAQVFEHWLEHRKPEIKSVTFRGYSQFKSYIVGPLVVATSLDRRRISCGKGWDTASTIPMLGECRISDLTTASIRTWHRTLTSSVGTHTANHAKKLLRAALLLAAEDFNLRIPVMPSRLGKGHQRPKKQVLTTDQVAVLVREAAIDPLRLAYVLFPFLTGVRPSGQLGLQWSDICFETRSVSIVRMQELDGTLSPYTKTTAGTRRVPLCKLVLDLLTEFRKLTRPTSLDTQIFSALGSGNIRHPFGQRLKYDNFRKTYWTPVLKRLGLPLVTPHTARHWFISSLQSRQIEVALVAKLAGHADVSVTLDHYTHALRGGEVAVRELDAMFPTALHSVQGPVLLPNLQPDAA